MAFEGTSPADFVETCYLFSVSIGGMAKFFGVSEGLGCAEAHPYNIELRRVLKDSDVFGLVRE